MREINIWKKILVLVLTGVFIAMIFPIFETYSLFQISKDGYGKVIAATQEDIISNMEIYYRHNTPILYLEKGENVDYSPIVFFAIEGDAKDYVIHMDSIKVDGAVEMEIVPNINLPQALSLITNPKEKIEGRIRVKHLNEFIDETLEFTFTKRYLLGKFFSNENLGARRLNYLSKDDKSGINGLIQDTLLYVDGYMDWDGIHWEERGNLISRINITRDQAALINIIAPNLLEYNERLYSLLEKVNKDLEEEIKKNKELFKENQVLNREINNLKLDKAKLHSHIYSLESKIKNLEEKLEKEEDKERN